MNAVPLPMPGALPEALRIACSWDLPSWKGQTLKLRLSEKGEPFATINHSAALRFTLPAGAASAVHLSLESGGVKVNARVSAADISLYVRAPEALAGSNFYLGGSTELNWENGAPDEILSSVSPHQNGKETAKVSVKHSCAFYSILPSDVDPTGVFGQTPKGRVQFRDNQKVGFELSRNGASTRVAVPSHGGWFVSSEPTTAFVKVVGALDLKSWYASEPRHESAARDTRVPGWPDSSCNADLQLVARVGSDSAVVGVIGQKTKFQVGPAAEGFTRVGLPSSDLLLTDNGQFAVRTSDLEACAQR